MNDEIRVKRSTLILGVALTVAVIAIAVLVTLLVTSRQPVPAAPVVADAPPQPAAPTASPTPTWPPLIVVGGTGGQSFPGLQAASVQCLSDASFEAQWVADMVLQPGGSSLVVDGASAEEIALYDAQAVALEVHQCILGVLGAPGGIVERMDRTRALDGTQRETWDAYQVTWTYHPDQGLDAVFSYAR